MAICEYLEETHPDTESRLLPVSPIDRFKVRRICEIVNAGMQPIGNLSVLQKVGSTFGEEHKIPWVQWVQERGFE